MPDSQRKMFEGTGSYVQRKGDTPMGGMMGLGFGMGAFGLIWMLIFWVGLIALAIWLVSLLFPAARKSSHDESISPAASDILKERYARGELTTEEYQEILHTIRQS
jgi:putative membrane protein